MLNILNLWDFKGGENNTMDDTCMTTWTNTRDEPPNVPCIFPFRYHGKMYFKCSFDSFGPWCSTRVTNDGDHDGFWGFCESDCPSTENDY